MITIDENILNALSAPVRRIDARVELYNCSTLQDDSYNRELLDTFCSDGELIDFKVERIADDGKFFGFGICQKLTVKLRDKERAININKGKVLEVSFGIDGDFTYPYPLFQVEEVIRDENNNNLTITAFDFLYKANEHRVSELTVNNYNLHTFVQACANLLNLPVKIEPTESFGTSYDDGANFEGSETIREALNAVAEATQTIFFVDWDWRLTFRRLDKDGDPVLHIDKSKYFELKNKSDRTLVAICHATELGDNVEANTGNPGVVQYVRNNPFWDLRDDIGELLTDAIETAGGITMSQFDCSWRGNYALEIGDKVTMETKNGDTLVAYILNDTLTYNGGLREQMNWTFTEHNAETASNPVNLGDALKQTFARVNKAEGYIELVAKDTQEMKDEVINEIASIRVQADGITSEVERVETKLDGAVKELNSSITQTASGITSQVQQVDKKIDNSVSTLQSQITQTAGSISSEVSRIETKFDGTTSTLSSQIQQTEKDIELKVSKDEIISAINLSTEGVDISSDKINLNGYVTVNDLSGNGTTTINGSNITTGTISADRINMSGAISWSDLSNSCQSTIASYAGADGEDADLPSYIKSTYIASTEIRSPEITGNNIKVHKTYQTIADVGTSQYVTGYIGAARGNTSDNTTTYGIALASDWDSSSYDVADNYVIVTNAGARMQSGTNRLYTTSDGIWLKCDSGNVWINNFNLTGFLESMAVSTIGDEGVGDYVIETGESGIWTYRKWQSGIAECWGKKAVSATINTAWGALYTSGALSGTNVTFPFTFSEVPVVNVSCYNNGAGVFIMAAGTWSPPSTTSTGTYELARGTASSSSASYGLNYHVVGRWK